jgi:hypothetical protein
MRGGRGTIWRERGDEFFLYRWRVGPASPRLIFRCVQRARSIPCVAETGSGRQTVLEKKRLLRRALNPFWGHFREIANNNDIQSSDKAMYVKAQIVTSVLYLCPYLCLAPRFSYFKWSACSLLSCCLFLLIPINDSVFLRYCTGCINSSFGRYKL